MHFLVNPCLYPNHPMCPPLNSWVLGVPYLYQHLLLTFFLMMVHRFWCLIMILIYPMINLCWALLHILINHFHIFSNILLSNKLLDVFILDCRSSLSLLDTSNLTNIFLVNILPQFVFYLFVLLTVSFMEQDLKTFNDV